MDILQERDVLGSQARSCANHMNMGLNHLETSEFSASAPAEVPSQDNLGDDFAFLDELSGEYLWKIQDFHSLDVQEILESVPSQTENCSGTPSGMLNVGISHSGGVPVSFELSQLSVHGSEICTELINFETIPEENCSETTSGEKHNHSTSPTHFSSHSGSGANLEYPLADSRSSYISTSDTEKTEDASQVSSKYQKKYLEMRRKNNIASRRSRQNRKQREAAVAKKANELEEENAKLKTRVEELEKQVEMLKSMLGNAVSKLSCSKCT